MTIAYNLGSFHKDLGSKSCVLYPMAWEIEDFSEFADDIRRCADQLFYWAKERYIIPSTLTIYLSVDRDHSFRIRMINVREYRELWETEYKTKWKFDRELTVNID